MPCILQVSKAFSSASYSSAEINYSNASKKFIKKLLTHEVLARIASTSNTS